MASRNSQETRASKWRRALLATGGLGIAVAGVCAARTLWLAPAAAQPVNPAAGVRAQTPQPTPPPGSATEYTAAIVASFNEHAVVTREELGDYLIARFGVAKLETCVNNRIIDKACRERKITVDAGEIEQRFAEDLKGINIDRIRFVKEFLRRANKNLVEWKEDVLRQDLLLAKLCRDRVTVTEEDIRDGFEARFGEKVDCRVIHWADEKEAQADYPRIHDEQTFLDVAKHQHTSALASTAGKIAAFGRHNMDNKDLETAAFALQPGAVSPLVKVPDGCIAIRCEGRIPADKTATLDKVKATIKDEILETKVQKEIKTIKATLRKDADPQCFLEKPAATLDLAETKIAAKAGRAPGTVVATIHGTIPVTRQELGEFLITRFGGEQVELLVHKRIIEEACRALNITVNDDEVEAGCADDCSRRQMDETKFVEEVLKPNRTTTYQWREDLVRPRLMLAKLCRERVKVTEEDLRMAFDAHHGEMVECRMILWPQDGMKQAMQNYAKIRDDDKEFDQAARAQQSPSLALKGGRTVISRHTTGDADLEKKAFGLQPGEVSELFGTPNGVVVLKCDRHIPPDASISFADRRPELEREVMERKIRIEIPIYFAELRRLAQPRLILRDPNKPEQLQEQAEAEVKDVKLPGKK